MDSVSSNDGRGVYLDERYVLPDISLINNAIDLMSLICWIRKNRPDLIVRELKAAPVNESKDFFEELHDTFCRYCYEVGCGGYCQDMD